MHTGVYQHYKGGYYQCFGIAEHTETKELFVVYVSLTGADLPGPRLRVRPIELWSDLVKWPGGFYYPRFKYIGDSIK